MRANKATEREPAERVERQREITPYELSNWAMSESSYNSVLSCSVSQHISLSTSSQFEFRFLSVKPRVLTNIPNDGCQHYFARRSLR